VRRFIEENLWTWAGTGLALITLSGVVLSRALLITGAALVIHSVLALVLRDKEPPT
jgi:hypothetical protein